MKFFAQTCLRTNMPVSFPERKKKTNQTKTPPKQNRKKTKPKMYPSIFLCSIIIIFHMLYLVSSASVSFLFHTRRPRKYYLISVLYSKILSSLQEHLLFMDCLHSWRFSLFLLTNKIFFH